MISSLFSPQRQVKAIRDILGKVAKDIEYNISVRLWDGTQIPLGKQTDTPYSISISGPGVIGSILRRPTPENLVRLYATGHIDFHGGDLIEIGQVLSTKSGSRKRLKRVPKWFLVRSAFPFLLAKTDESNLSYEYKKDAVGRTESRRSNKDYIQFHYDVGNDFYALFLDPEMQYSCSYFKNWENSLAQAQIDKLEMICRKLRLQSGEKLLDIGCGWGGLICYAAKHFGVHAHGLTLSQEQYDYTTDKIKKLGLEDRVTVEICDYLLHEGCYDKIASIGMFEHIGLANFKRYFRKINSLLRDRGIVLNHGIARRAKSSKKKTRKIRPERRLILKYIFPGTELAPISHTVESMELCGFEVHDVEAWREHYALTCKHWCQRLSARKKEGIQLVGNERYRLWVAYLAGVSFAFANGSLRINQVVATKHASRGASGMPPTRHHLYV